MFSCALSFHSISSFNSASIRFSSGDEVNPTGSAGSGGGAPEGNAGGFDEDDGVLLGRGGATDLGVAGAGVAGVGGAVVVFGVDAVGGATFGVDGAGVDGG